MLLQINKSNQNKYSYFQKITKMSKKSMTYEFKAVKFKPNTLKKSLSAFNRAVISDVLNCSQDWFINEQKYLLQKWYQIFSHLITVDCKKIIFEWNLGAGNIIKQIVHVHFPNLKHLSFCANNIVSIECLQLLYAPNLKQLSLSNNQISNFVSLRKVNLPKLQILDLFSNNSPKLDSLQQLHCSNLFKLSIQMTTLNNVMGIDLRFTVKLESKKLRWLWSQSKHRIKQESVMSIMNSRKVQGLQTKK